MRIPIHSKKLGTHELLIDDVDYARLKGWSFYLWSTPRHSGIYVNCYSVNNKAVPLRLHRVIMNAKKGELVDHINRNPLDNRQENLRLTTSLVNNQNAGKRKDGLTSKFKGVNFHKAKRPWKAQIQVQGKKISLGNYATEIEAAIRYNQALDEYNIVGPRNVV